MYLPKDPAILLSVVNTKLRDDYDNIDSFCEDQDVSKDEIDSILNAAGYSYDSSSNQYK